MKTTKTICIFLICVLLTPLAHASISAVPSIMAAPVVLYDEANNVLADGTYTVAISLYDITNTAVYSEEQSVAVNNGVAMITIGQGYTVGSGMASPAGGLSWNVFDVTGDVTVEIYVEGQASPQLMTVLGSQPYAFIAQHALDVADNAITTDKIQDGTITEADLDEGLLERIQSGGDGSDSSSSSDGVENVTAANVAVSSTIGLNNASGSNVEEILQGFDASIDLLRGTHLAQGLEDVQSTVQNLDGTYATDADLSSVNSSLSDQISSLSSTVSTNSSNISILQTDVVGLREDVDRIDTTVDIGDIPQAVRPFAYGSKTNTTTCSGYNVNTSSYLTYTSGATTSYGCYFSTPTGTSNYTVVVTIDTRDMTPTPASCYAQHKASEGFTVFCQSTSSMSQLYSSYDFVVYKND